jgi:triphosphatase
MVETELKFQVPEASRAAVQRAVATASAVTTRLRARYFDTDDRRLAAAGVALRLRQEGRTWVQTLKAAHADAGLAHRLEHEVRLPPGSVTLDLHRHAGTAAAAALEAALGVDAPPLEQVFEADVRRLHRVVRAGAARVELALDIGVLRAAGRSLPLWELELELQSGSSKALFELAARWVQRHQLWLDVRSKAERGFLLGQGQQVRPATGWRAPVLQKAWPAAETLRAMSTACLGQALPNAAALAGGVGGPDHLHQLRVGLRRLRSVMRLFGDDPPAGAPPLDADLADLFRCLGVARDRDVFESSTGPALAAAGGSPLPWPDERPTDDAGAALRDPRHVCTLLRLMAQAEPGPPSVDVPHPDRTPLFDALARDRLYRLHRRLRRQARAFATLDADARHRLRRQIKRLRYGVDATQGFWPAQAVRRYLAALRPLQDALGLCNDLQVADDAVRSIPQERVAAPDAAAAQGFALGWLAARRAQAVADAAGALQHWPKCPKAWRPA